MGGATPEEIVQELKRSTLNQFKNPKTYTSTPKCENKKDDKEKLKSLLLTNSVNFSQMFTNHYETRKTRK